MPPSSWLPTVCLRCNSAFSDVFDCILPAGMAFACWDNSGVHSDPHFDSCGYKHFTDVEASPCSFSGIHKHLCGVRLLTWVRILLNAEWMVLRHFDVSLSSTETEDAGRRWYMHCSRTLVFKKPFQWYKANEWLIIHASPNADLNGLWDWLCIL